MKRVYYVILVLIVSLVVVFGFTLVKKKPTEIEGDIMFTGTGFEVKFDDPSIKIIKVKTLKGAGLVINDIPISSDNVFYLNLKIKKDELTSIEVQGFDKDRNLKDTFKINNILLSFDSKSKLIKKAEYLHMLTWDNFEDYSRRISNGIKGMSLDLRDEAFKANMISKYKQLESLNVKFIDSEGGFKNLSNLVNLKRLILAGGPIEDSSFLSSKWSDLIMFIGDFRNVDLSDYNGITSLNTLALTSESYSGTLRNNSINYLRLTVKSETNVSVISSETGHNLETLVFNGNFTGDIYDLPDALNLKVLVINSPELELEKKKIKMKYPKLEYIKLND